MPNFDLILANVSKHIELDDKERDLFLSILEPKVLERRKVYLRQGTVCRYVAFVLSGALKSYKVDDEGKEHILNFAVRDWWIADLYSFISQKPAVLNIETIEESEVLLLSQKDQEMLFGKIQKFERFFRVLVENALVASQQRLIDNMSLTAEERYLQFIKKYPSIPVLVPQHSIASYLGITPEFLSKIRKRLARK